MMRLLFLCMFSSALWATSDAMLAKKAYRAARQGEVADAVTFYQDMKEKNAAVWYNMANLAFEQKEYAKAHLYWLRAIKHADVPLFAAAWHNMQQGDTEQGALETLWYWLLYIQKKMGILFLQLLFLLLWYLFWYRNRFTGLVKTCAIVSMPLAVLLIGPIWAGYRLHIPYAMIVEQKASLYNGPNDSFYTVATLEPGALLRIEQQKETWYKVQHDGHQGWIAADAIELV